MNFSEKCAHFIADHRCSDDEERHALDTIRRNLPVSSSSIDWSRVVNKKEVSDVDRGRLSAALKDIANSMGLVGNDILTIINIDDAFPALETSLFEWLMFASELDFIDTIFFSKNRGIIIHWDFFKTLHATFI